VIALPKKGHSFVAQNIHFTPSVFCGDTDQCSCRLPSVGLGRKGMDYVRAEECVNSARTSLALMTSSFSRLIFSPRDDVRFVTGHIR